MNRFSITLCIIIAATAIPAADSSALEEWRVFSRLPESGVLIAWLRENARLSLERKSMDFPLSIKLPELNGRAGMFITLIKKGKVRGCFGALYHDSDDTAGLFLRYLKGALYMDPRYAPIEPSELDDTSIIVTITSFPEPVDDINNVDIGSFGVFIECGAGEWAVVVPAEFKTSMKIESLYGKSDCRYSKFRAVTIR